MTTSVGTVASSTMRTAAEEKPPLLTEGIHELTTGQVREICVSAKRFSGSTSRASLMDNLELLVEAFSQQGIGCEIWLDGSFLTEEINPRDVDLSVRVASVDYENGTASQVELLNLVNELDGTKHIHGFLFFDFPIGHLHHHLGPEMLAYWKKQWG
ncbi:MAG: hypothetical protein IAG10_05380, partial [Planctomycetaceae bacterium]|nr:hypothetical protein [Planctomycetaceae bacterium]